MELGSNKIGTQLRVKGLYRPLSDISNTDKISKGLNGKAKHQKILAKILHQKYPAYDKIKRLNKRNNTEISKVRKAEEHCFKAVKNWKCITKYDKRASCRTTAKFYKVHKMVLAKFMFQIRQQASAWSICDHKQSNITWICCFWQGMSLELYDTRKFDWI